jgi:hypothetical protein
LAMFSTRRAHLAAACQQAIVESPREIRIHLNWYRLFRCAPFPAPRYSLRHAAFRAAPGGILILPEQFLPSTVRHDRYLDSCSLLSSHSKDPRAAFPLKRLPFCPARDADRGLVMLRFYGHPRRLCVKRLPPDSVASVRGRPASRPHFGASQRKDRTTRPAGLLSCLKSIPAYDALHLTYALAYYQ